MRPPKKPLLSQTMIDAALAASLPAPTSRRCDGECGRCLKDCAAASAAGPADNWHNHIYDEESA